MNTETEYMSPISILRLFETTRSERGSFVTQIVERLENGDAEPLQVHLQIKAMEDLINQLTSKDEKKNKNVELAKRYSKLLLDAAQKYGSKSFEVYNAKFEIKETGTKYDFSKTEDKKLNELYAEQKRIDEEVKNRETFLKTVPLSGIILTEEETGDTYKVYPPSKTSSTSLATTLK